MNGNPETNALIHNGATSKTMVELPMKSKSGPFLFLLGSFYHGQGLILFLKIE